MRETSKTGKGRPVSLLPEATVALSVHRTRYLEELVRYRALWEAAWAKNPEYRDLVFPSKAGTPLDHGNVNRQQFKRLLKKAALPSMRPNDIRHSFATLWIESGESAEVLQKVSGHSSWSRPRSTLRPPLAPLPARVFRPLRRRPRWPLEELVVVEIVVVADSAFSEGVPGEQYSA
jgi:integrase